MSQLLGRTSPAQEASCENDVILTKIEALTGTRILVAPFDPLNSRRCFLLMGEEEWIARAKQLLTGAIQQKVSPSREAVAHMLAVHGGEGPDADGRLEEIRQELRDKYKLRMIEMKRDGTSSLEGRGGGGG